MRSRSTTFSKQAEIGDIASSVRHSLKRLIWPLTTLCGIGAAIFSLYGNPAATGFVLIAGSSLIALAVWANSGEGLPLIPLFAVQNLVVYGLPIVVGNEAIQRYPFSYVTSAGWEVAVFNIAMILSWRIAMELIPTSSRLCFALQGFEENSPRLGRIGMTLLVSGTAYDVLQSANLLDPVLDLLPAGSNSILHVLVSASTACGCFLVGMMIGRGTAGARQRTVFWVLLAVECIIASSGFLLSACITIIFSAIIGLFWGSGRIPWRFVGLSLSILAFLNLGKFTMREKYWHPTEDEPQPEFSLEEMPRYYGEWIGASFDALAGRQAEVQSQTAFTRFGGDQNGPESEQNLLSRINNLQNLLFVIDAMDSKHIKPLGGVTYSLIPPLLVPRVLWPNKPRSHEGQVLLNVYFGRQDLTSTFQTYIAWGLLPEAYGNFGPITGAILLGVFLGVVFAWVEKFVARKLLLSTEGFLSFTIFLGLANSYEMVASVVVTSVFQACVPIVLASAPFVDRILPRRAGETNLPATASNGPKS